MGKTDGDYKMLILSELKEEDKGRRVRYTPFEGCDPDMIEEGRISSWNDHYVFVKYDEDLHNKATPPGSLDFIE
jgi:hypothetical protein